MRTFEIEIQGDDWNGAVSLKLLPYKQRLDLAKKVDAIKGEIAQAEFLGDLLKENLTGLVATHKSGTTFEGMEDLEYYEEGTSLMGALLPLLVKGAPLGNVLKLTSKEQQGKRSKDSQ